MKSKFKVYHYNNACLGIAVLSGNRVSYKTNTTTYAWFEARDTEWLKQFRAIVRKLCRNVGHTSKYSISEDTDSGIVVERI